MLSLTSLAYIAILFALLSTVFGFYIFFKSINHKLGIFSVKIGIMLIGFGMVTLTIVGFLLYKYS